MKPGFEVDSGVYLLHILHVATLGMLSIRFDLIASCLLLETDSPRASKGVMTRRDEPDAHHGDGPLHFGPSRRIQSNSILGCTPRPSRRSVCLHFTGTIPTGKPIAATTQERNGEDSGAHRNTELMLGDEGAAEHRAAQGTKTPGGPLANSLSSSPTKRVRPAMSNTRAPGGWESPAPPSVGVVAHAPGNPLMFRFASMHPDAGWVEVPDQRADAIDRTEQIMLPGRIVIVPNRPGSGLRSDGDI